MVIREDDVDAVDDDNDDEQNLKILYEEKNT